MLHHKTGPQAIKDCASQKKMRQKKMSARQQ